jgi:hypothetical protein
VVCGYQARWVWDDDLPLPGELGHVPEPGCYEVDNEWLGEAFHCSRRCYLAGSECRSPA